MAVWSIIKKSETEGSSRIDAEYYQPKYLFIDSNIRKSSFGYKSLKEVGAKVVSGPFGSSLKSKSYLKEGVPFIRISDLYYFFIRKDNLVYISELDNQRLHSSQLQEGDLVLSKVGNTIGVVSIITNDIGRVNISENNIGIKLQRLDYGVKIFLLTFLNSKLGQEQILRRISGNAQPKLNIADIYEINFYNPTENVLQIVENLVVNAKKCVDDSNIFYSQAEQILLEELGLKDLDLKDDLFCTTTLKEVKDNNRMDAEYYLPKYEELIAHIRNYKNGYCGLLDIAQNITTNYDPLKEGECFRYIELSNIQASIGIIENAKSLRTEDAPSRAKRKLKKGDVIVSSIKGSLDKTAMVVSDFDGAFASNGFFQFRAKSVNPAYLTLLVKSDIVYLQLFKEASGAILSAVPKESLKNIIIPKLEKNIQEEISKLVQNAHEKYYKSKLLLEQAKHKVEEMIEKEAG